MKWSRLLIPKTIVLFATAALTLTTFPVLPNHTYADGVIQKDQIRVALFIDTTKYKLLEPIVTMSSTSGLEIGVRNGGVGTTKTWASVADASAVRFSLDQFSVNLLETADYTAAKALYTQLSTMQLDGYVLSRMKQGKTVYQVYFGSFPTKEAAEIAMAQTLKDSKVAALTKLAAPVLSGPMHLTAGIFATETEALQQIGLYAQAGLIADLALQEDVSGKLVYGVWVGSEATIEQLNIVKQLALKAAPSVPLQEANTKSSYLLRRSDVTASANGTVAVPHYAAGTVSQKTWIHPKGAGITVKERAERSYRGDMEVSAYHDKLALVNELPLEQYLYAVVGTELNSGWPIEALKAQVVASRTYALKQGNKYEIAQVTDSTMDQAYYGMQREFASGTQAVEATKSEVITDRNGLISPVFSSNSGGMTADPSEVWGNPAAYLRSVPSPDDGAEKGKANWYRIQLADGKTGYVHAMYLKDTGEKNKDGASYYEATEAGVNVRLAPYVDNAANPSIDQLTVKERVLILGQEKESNAYSWVRGPYDAEDIKNKLNAAGVSISGDLQSLEISKRGPSGRVTELKANGVVIKVPYPDALRAALGGLPSTRFEIEQAGSYTGSTPSGSTSNSAGLIIVGAGSTNNNNASSDSIYLLSGGQSQPTSVKKNDLTALGSSGSAQAGSTSTTTPSLPPLTGAVQGKQFIFRGTGFGHGLGMSQWGARGYAELGYNYQKILQTYYTGVNITKE
jgi:stage II sporulation protein D